MGRSAPPRAPPLPHALILQGVFADAKKNLCVVITTDRGLCGSVNSSLTRSLRREIGACAAAAARGSPPPRLFAAASPPPPPRPFPPLPPLAAESSRTTGADLRLFILGEKGRAQVARDYTPMMARSLDGYLDRDPVFSLAAAIASRIIAEPYDVVTLWYNEYENQVKFSGVYKKLPQLAALPTGQMPESLKKYESEPAGPELLINLQEYAVAAALYYALLETVACETSQRVTAMDNASTNAKDMVSRFKLLYNRARQAKITTELTEIISGSESLVVSTVSD